MLLQTSSILLVIYFHHYDATLAQERNYEMTRLGSSYATSNLLTEPAMGAFTGLPPTARRMYLVLRIRLSPAEVVTSTVCASISFPRPSVTQS